MMYMREYTVASLRIKLKEALDAVIRGEEVRITRLGQTFVIQPVNALTEPLEVPRESVKDVETPGGSLEFCKHDQVKGFCKKGCR